MEFLRKQFVGVIALVIAVLGLMSGSTGGGLGTEATTITNPWTFEETTGTTTVTVQSNASGLGGCIAVEQQDGSGYGYFIADSTGSLATTTSSGC